MTSGAVPLTRAEAPLIGDIIADAFHDDPVMVWAMGGVGALRPINTLLAKYIYLAPGGFGHRTEGGEAGSLWMAPGEHEEPGTPAQLHIAWTLLCRGGMTGLRRGFAMGDALGVHHPKGPHYYLFAIAVRSAHQGRGLGGRIMRAGLDRADADGVGAYLENSKERNLPFYRAHGFEVTEKITPLPGCPPLWLMWRDPR